MKISKFLHNLQEKQHRQVQMICGDAVPAGSVAVLISGDGKHQPLVPFTGDGEYPAPGPLLRLPSSLDLVHMLVLSWQAINFDDKATVDGTINHLATELAELREAINSGNIQSIQAEVADLFVLLTQLAALLNVDLGEATLEKLMVLETRDYSAQPDEQGRILHTKTPPLETQQPVDTTKQ
jgi:NTP pyrophosphatase (non-canonical NTP hydrolase)